MRQVMPSLRALLCVVLSVQLSLPGLTAAQEGGRDLEVEALVGQLKERAALWVLTVGVSRYADPQINLRFADHDAARIAQMLKSQEGVLFKEVFTRVLVNEEATREGILRGMSEFLAQAGPGDVIVIFVAGHGLQDRQTGTYYFVPYNANAENLVYAGLPMPMFQEAVKRLRGNVDKLILWMDTCHAGAASMAARGVNVGEDLAEALSQASGQYVMSASKAGEQSMEDEQYRFAESDPGHGAFTYSLLRGLQGEAGAQAGGQVVWLSDLFSHVSKEVPRLTRGRQHPHGEIQGTDLPLFVRDPSVLAELSKPVAVQTPAYQPQPTAAPAAAPAVVPTRKGGGRGWLWAVLGVAAVGGGAAAAVTLKPKDEEPETGSITVDVVVP
ncbi:MAG: caspase family protein [Candidatus Latescibacterota bacterium]